MTYTCPDRVDHLSRHLCGYTTHLIKQAFNTCFNAPLHAWDIFVQHGCKVQGDCRQLLKKTGTKEQWAMDLRGRGGIQVRECNFARTEPCNVRACFGANRTLIHSVNKVQEGP